MASITETLPSEIIDQLIDIIADDDDNDQSQYQFELRNVKACFLTCRALAILCRRRIYRSVSLFDSDNQFENQLRDSERPVPSLARSFAELITNRPEIKDYVRELVYHIEVYDASHSVPVALAGLKKLERICIHPEAGYLVWPIVVSSDSWRLVSRLMRRPAVTSLTLHYVTEFRISDLANYTHLKRLILNFCIPSEENISPPSPSPPTHSIKLRDFQFWPYPKSGTNLFKCTYADGTPILDTSELRKVTIMINNPTVEVDSLAEFFNSLTNMDRLHLQVLQQTLQGQEAPEYIPRLLSAPLMMTLKILSLNVSLNSGLSDLSDITSWFKSLSTKNSIKMPTIRIHFYRYSEKPSHLCWNTLKETILGLNWPSLTHVDLTLLTTNSSTAGAKHVDGPVTFLRLSPNHSFIEVQ